MTSHVPISAVAGLITSDNVLRGLRLTDRRYGEGGYKAPRIVVAGSQPHAGDGGNFGREEIDFIAPAVEASRADGIGASGTDRCRRTRSSFGQHEVSLMPCSPCITTRARSR